MPSIWKRLSHQPKIEDYHFPTADDLKELDPPDEPEPTIEEPPEAVEAEPEEEPKQPPSFAEIQAETILQEAREQAEALLRQAKEQAETIRQDARDEGYAEGFTQGLAVGTQQGKEEVLQQQTQQTQMLADQVEQFLKKANAALLEQMDANAVELRDLAIAVAEKVIGVSLDSSADVIERMIRMAIDKRKRCEWVQIYVSSRNARRLAELSPVLTTSFAALSDHVRIVPMSDDEPGACIVEMPDEIIDASVSTQMGNIRAALAETPLDNEDSMIRPGLERGLWNVSKNDPSGSPYGAL